MWALIFCLGIGAPVLRAEVIEYNDEPNSTLYVDIFLDYTFEQYGNVLSQWSGFAGTASADYGGWIWLPDEVYYDWTTECQESYFYSSGGSWREYRESWESFDDFVASGSTDWSPGCGDTWEDQSYVQSRENWEWHRVGERSNFGEERNVSWDYRSTTEYRSDSGCRPLNWQSFEDTVSDWHEVSGGPNCSNVWEDQSYTYNYTEERTRRVGWRNDRDGVVTSETVTDSRGGSRTETGCRPLNWRSFEDVTQDWHPVSDWSPSPSGTWEDQTCTQTRSLSRTRRTGERNDRGDERNVGTQNDSSSESRMVPGTRPLNWHSFNETVTDWHEVGRSPSPSGVWEDTQFTQTVTDQRTVRTGETNDRGDTRNVQTSTESRSRNVDGIWGTRPLNWHFWQNVLRRDWYDSGWGWNPTTTTKYFWEDVFQNILRLQDWEEWQVNDRGNTRLLRIFTVYGLLSRTVKGTKVPTLSAVQVGLPGGPITLGASGGTATLPNGTVISGNTNGSGSVTIPGSVISGGATVTTNGGMVSITTTTGTTTPGSGSSVSLGAGITVNVTSSGDATVTFPGGVSVAVGAGGGAIVLPGGAAINVATGGRIDINLPPGTNSVLTKAVDLAGTIYNAGAGHVISVRNILTQVIGPLPSNPLLDAIDIGIAAGGVQLGLRQGSDGPYVWTSIYVQPMPPPQIAVDANRDGSITFDPADATDAAHPYRFWINDDNDDYTTGPNYADGVVNGWNDLKKDFFPVFLDIKQLLNALPPSSGATYKLKQADGALNFIYADLTRATAFAYKSQDQADPARPPYPLSVAQVVPVTAQGVVLSTSFLESIKNGDQGVLLMEARAASNQPLVLSVEKDGAVVAQATLWLSLGQDILLLLHGMNSNTYTWDAFVDSPSGYYGAARDIADGAIQGPAPARNSDGVRCYRLQFGAYDMASTRVGVEGVTAANTPGYDTVGTRCGDFQTFAELGQEVEDAITLLLNRHPNARIVLVGHSRGGLSARAFLEKPGSSPAKAAVVGMLTTSSPNLGSRMGRIYGWLNTHPRGTPQGYSDDWQVVDFLIQPSAYGQPKTVLDVRRPVILDVADNSLAIANLNAQTAVQNLPASIRYGEIQYANSNFGTLTITPVRYSVLEASGAGGVLFPQLSSAAKDFLLSGGAANDVQFIGDGLIPRANQRFTQLAGFPGIGVAPLVVIDREVVHIGAPSQLADLLTQLKLVAPGMFR